MSVTGVRAIQEPLVEAQRAVKTWMDLCAAAGNMSQVGELARILRLLDVAAIACLDAIAEAEALSELEVPA